MGGLYYAETGSARGSFQGAVITGLGFGVLMTGFFAVVLGSWWLFRPRRYAFLKAWTEAHVEHGVKLTSLRGGGTTGRGLEAVPGALGTRGASPLREGVHQCTLGGDSCRRGNADRAMTTGHRLSSDVPLGQTTVLERTPERPRGIPTERGSAGRRSTPSPLPGPVSTAARGTVRGPARPVGSCRAQHRLVWMTTTAEALCPSP